MRKILIISAFYILISHSAFAYRYLIPLAGVKITYPQAASLSFGAGLGITKNFGHIVQIEPGLNGGKINFGIGHLYVPGYDYDPNRKIVIQPSPVAYAYKLSLFKPWKNNIGLNPNQTFLGLEYENLSFFLKTAFHIGLYANISGKDSKPNILASFGFGFLL